VALPHVEVELARPEAHIRRNACLALGLLDARDALDLLSELAEEDPDEDVRDAASEAFFYMRAGDEPFKGPTTNGAIAVGGGARKPVPGKKQEEDAGEKPG